MLLSFLYGKIVNIALILFANVHAGYILLQNAEIFKVASKLCRANSLYPAALYMI
jgi:hypothetical protein